MISLEQLAYNFVECHSSTRLTTTRNEIHKLKNTRLHLKCDVHPKAWTFENKGWHCEYNVLVAGILYGDVNLLSFVYSATWKVLKILAQRLNPGKMVIENKGYNHVSTWKRKIKNYTNK